MLSPGDKVKDYEVIAPLGSGGMAMLYLARRRGVGGFSRLVTLKLVHQHLLEDENIIKRFLDEARISAQVAHPNVVHVEEVGQCGDSYFIAMEYVHGVSLAELLARLTERRLRLRPQLCVWLAAQIAEALHAAHEAKGESGVPLDIVHRDVSPQNVLIGHTGHVKLIDFGIAKTQSQSQADDRSGGRAVLGKLRYMAPEQLQLERADRRTDVYALGVMLWEMLAGRSLLRCQRVDDERDWATRENPPPPSKHSSLTTPELDRVVLKAIAYDASERYDSALELRSDLLRADPSAVQVDAPRVALLLRSMLGDELERRRAGWPQEVAVELEVGPEITNSQAWSLDELTAEHVTSPRLSVSGEEPVSESDAGAAPSDAGAAPSDAGAAPSDAGAAPNVRAVEHDDSDNEPTLADSPSALDSSPHPPAAVSGMTSAVDTLKLLPSQVVEIGQLLDRRTIRAAGAVLSVCLALGVCLGRWMSPAPPPPEVEARLEPARRPPSVYAEHVTTPAVHIESTVLTASQPDASEGEVRDRDEDVEPARAARASRHYGAHRGVASRAKQTAKPVPNSKPKNVSNRKAKNRLARSMD